MLRRFRRAEGSVFLSYVCTGRRLLRVFLVPGADMYGCSMSLMARVRCCACGAVCTPVSCGAMFFDRAEFFGYRSGGLVVALREKSLFVRGKGSERGTASHSSAAAPT